jgi:SLBB domain
VLHEPIRSLPAPPGALNEADVPDPLFWGPDEATRRRRRAASRARRAPTPTERRAALVLVTVIAVAGCVLALLSSAAPAPSTPTPSRAAAVTGRSRRVIVHIAGAVTRPGVVDLPRGSRVIDAVDAAGGALAAADLDRVNLAAPLQDGEQVLVPLTPSTPPTSPSPTSTP